MVNPAADLLKKIDSLVRKDRRYKPEAFLFVLAALHYTVSSFPETRHVTGQELLGGIRLYALDQFGPLTTQVFEYWGVTCTEDFGHIVFLLVTVKLLGKTAEDSIEDFREIYDFAEAFNPEPLYKLPEDWDPPVLQK